MAFISGSIPNLIGGVSQQPAGIRALNCSTALLNTWSDVVTGLSTRPAGMYLGAIGGSVPSGESVATHVINKSDGDYLVSVYNGAVRVCRIDGTFEQQTVTVEGAAGLYLIAGTTDYATDIGFVTVGDTTFIYNREKVVTTTATAEGTGTTGIEDGGVYRRNPNRYHTVWTKQSTGYSANFTVYWNGVQADNYSSLDTDNASQITEELLDGVTTYGLAASYISSTVFIIEGATEGNIVTVRDDFGDQALFAYNDFVPEFTDLPNIDMEGRLVMIQHGIEEAEDDYWVWYKSGVWEETYGWNAYEVLDATTMPIILVHEGGTAWTLKRTVWPGREVGDADSNPTPSFVGRTIRHMMLYKGRMVILSDENFVASRISNFENFYRQTCTQLLDEDPIDIASANSRGAPLNFAKEFNGGLLLFTAFDQFKIEADSEGLLSPNTVTIKKVNSYNNSPDAEPSFVGPNVCFVDDFGAHGFASIREYQVDRTFGNEIALPITDPIPEYIPTGVYKVVGSSTYNNLAVVSSGYRPALWLYNYYFNSEGKVQSAWQKWAMAGDIYSVDYSRDTLVVTVSYGGDLRVLGFVFNAGADAILDKSSILLDFGVHESACTVVPNPPELGGGVHVYLPYVPEMADHDNVVLVVSPSVPGTAVAAQTYTPDSIVGASLWFRDTDLDGSEFVVGLKYLFSWTPSPIFMRDRNLVAIQDGRLQLRRLSLMYHNSGPFEATFTPSERDPYVSTFSGFMVGGGTDELGELSLDSGEFRIAVNGRGEVMDLTLTALTPWRVRFSVLEWEGSWRPKKRRM
jgi:hypothetical protein